MKKVTLLLALFAFCSWQVVLAQKTINGVVTDAKDGLTIPGVNVVVKGTTTGTTTGLDGGYTLKVPANAQTLVFSFVGYETQEVAIGTQSLINIALNPTAEQLKEVVVTALGIKRDQKALGYAMSSVSSKEITKVGASNFGSALYGKASGVRISTAPGGATSAVNINIRGTNSITGTSTPLIIVDGVPIRNGENNNLSYWDDQRIRGNGLIDINPEDIENVSILKGAAASALYGSEAANGVVLITTKSGKGAKKGVTVDLNASYIMEKVAYTPDYQNEFGPGYDRGTNMGSFGSDDQGWLTVTENGNDYYRPIYRSYAQFGPKFDGRDVMNWNGEVVPYVAQPDNMKDLYQTGFGSMVNFAVSQNSDNGSYRFAYTRNDDKGIQKNNKHFRNSFVFNGNFKVSKRIAIDLSANYINQYTKNRATRMWAIGANYGGFFSRMDDMQWYYDAYKTSLGYKWDRYDVDPTKTLTYDERLKYHIRAYDLLDMLWNMNENSSEEYNNRLLANLTTTIDIFKGLKFRGRVATDYTSDYQENRNPNERPISLGFKSGSFGQANSLYTIAYGDALLMYNKDITSDIKLNANLGVTGRKEWNTWTNRSTRDGLSVENWWSINASNNENPWSGSGYTEFIKFAYLGTLQLSYKDWAFIEATGRQESSSTLPPESNSFFYPSVSASVILSEALELPKVINYAKIRTSYGVVGNAPSLYAANNAYNLSSFLGTIYNSVPTSYGNDLIRPEEKHEFEIGLETRFFNSRLGFEFSFYNAIINDQILQLQVPATVGASSMLANVGKLKNQGFEFAFFGTPVKKTDFQWDARLNFGFNRNEVLELMPGVDRLEHYNIDAGAALIVSEPNKPMGEILCFMPMKDPDGNYIIENGEYKVDFTEMKSAGNVQPKAVGGLGNTVSYKGIVLDFLIDFRWGGSIMSLYNRYAGGAGMFTSTLDGRDAEHGGVAYYVDGSGTKVATTSTAGPDGETVYHDGMILDGVKEIKDESGTVTGYAENDVIVDAPTYYLDALTWGANPAWGSGMSRYDLSIYDNSYIKFRELSLGYNLPKTLISKIGLSNLQVSLVGRNLFFIYKNLPNMDSEVLLGSNWINQGIDTGTSTASSRSFGITFRASF
jgi:iron complex outermembrane recepter protein